MEITNPRPESANGMVGRSQGVTPNGICHGLRLGSSRLAACTVNNSGIAANVRYTGEPLARQKPRKGSRNASLSSPTYPRKTTNRQPDEIELPLIV